MFWSMRTKSTFTKILNARAIRKLKQRLYGALIETISLRKQMFEIGLDNLKRSGYIGSPNK